MENNKPRYSPALHHALSLVERMCVGQVLILPAEPTLPMAVAGARAGHVSRAVARTVYRAMARVGQN